MLLVINYSLRFKMSVVLGCYTHIKKCNNVVYRHATFTKIALLTIGAFPIIIIKVKCGTLEVVCIIIKGYYWKKVINSALETDSDIYFETNFFN